ncbi:uncharacterized protein E0L32_011376 [Thyridium curvatum]|uniref:Tafazzin n=1 Tax=Thyridium curvatum TaxID=1093900 RepID=A0A507BPZ0_9PEZI|nr:uncharacterized protein E0L32_011376 [Thyridium curvatum]TPX18898.1 hypothetical protein E0L32_011376 [Thyridium curvatum]
MPKKRHQARYTKPQSTAPSSLRRRDSPSQYESGSQGRGVNQMLADLRRVGLNAHPHEAVEVSQIVAPSVPPSIRQFLQLPETPPPRPRRPPRTDAAGRRLPPGPAPPRSWVSRSDTLESEQIAGAYSQQTLCHSNLPDVYVPSRISLMNLVLRRMVRDWAFVRDYDRYYLSSLPRHIRSALIANLSLSRKEGISLADVRLILLPPPGEGVSSLEDEAQQAVAANDDLEYLDLSGSVGKSIKIRDLSDLMFPSNAVTTEIVQDSWEAPDTGSIPRSLFPNLTHLALSLDPQHTCNVSWKQLLAFSTHLPHLTHLSLAYWPEPCLTPNAKLATVVAQQGQTVQFGGTGPYSHSLDNDWAEAVLVLRRLSKSLYGLEYLDLTGCAAWAPALMHKVDHDEVDWVGDWGKISTLVLRSGYSLTETTGRVEVSRYINNMSTAMMVERRIRTQRAGRGHFITVYRDSMPENMPASLLE